MLPGIRSLAVAMHLEIHRVYKVNYPFSNLSFTKRTYIFTSVFPYYDALEQSNPAFVDPRQLNTFPQEENTRPFSYPEFGLIKYSLVLCDYILLYVVLHEII
ncbi:unnamed protein product [Photorhabdus laumondii subsp. laumondii TTO1]|uniref:Photorhabdus luminescens subsp. laumondii TTO1 complete genome segment 3/17 n=1 Tax=Photorhabdus laumondii subsp. laumondii (strain DSM 15139 / CIP 105565 / TT01) TaxID=243265 RepID=Q7N8J7_PHOLL|nr:unnamed protein product [Photorhabdus laumondii subsp. laumondii TTO1]